MTTYQVPREFAYGGSYVDETLFGESRAKKTAARRRAASRAGESIAGGKGEEQPLRITRREYEEIVRRANTPLAVFEQTVCARLLRACHCGSTRPPIRGPSGKFASLSLTHVPVLPRTRYHQRLQQETSRRKEHRVPIQPLHKEKPTPEQEYERQYRETVGIGGANIRAYNMRNDELDEVKALHSHLEVMKVKAGVDQGLKTKQLRQEQIEEYERQKEREMEDVRVRGLRAEAAREEAHRAQAKQAQQALLAQVAQRQQLELLDEERMAQENIQMRRHLQQLEEQDRQKKQQAAQAQALRNLELAKSNQLAEKCVVCVHSLVYVQQQQQQQDRSTEKLS